MGQSQSRVCGTGSEMSVVRRQGSAVGLRRASPDRKGSHGQLGEPGSGEQASSALYQSQSCLVSVELAARVLYASAGGVGKTSDGVAWAMNFSAL